MGVPPYSLLSGPRIHVGDLEPNWQSVCWIFHLTLDISMLCCAVLSPIQSRKTEVFAMRIHDNLKSLKGQVMKEIGEAARKQDTQRINMLSKIATRIQEDEQILSTLEEHVVEYQRELAGTAPKSSSLTPLDGTAKTVSMESGVASRHGKGRDARRRFVGTLQQRGVQLTHSGGKVYRTPSGKRIGVPFANELEDKPDRWFLGLKDGN